ncbi:RNA polymerase sigma-70 factor (ECF subfamily) [Paenibacillus forsythiae]|uniref:RNA polymerase sigma-70 factor (ECF subfamily) n=1 Tax=Paenibacillus forsythiae TaxID=365616 RepID=A0ABU3H3C0_9BACL|nr:RNA polymerase sigma factor [Paenibacillus forsythiae]MDT3425314.1 RNA polymerase sigma-70 factor (ECF subfamily) [Paenibacillus forsythiae]
MNIEEVIQRVQQGDSNAFEPIIHAYQQRLFAYCFYMLGNRQEAEDAVQEVFIRSYQSLHLYRFDQSFPAWLYKIAGNQCLTLLKRRKIWNALLPKFWRQFNEPSAEEEMWKQVSADLLKGLTVEERQIIILHVLEGYTLDEIAQSLQLKAGTVRKRFERIRKKLKKTSTNWEGSTYEKTIGI